MRISKKKIQINELVVGKNGKYTLAYSWFGDGFISTGDFRKFRFAEKSGRQWKHWQVSVPIDDLLQESLENGRAVFQDFLDTFGESRQADNRW